MKNMKKRALTILLTTMMMGSLLSACASNNNDMNPTPSATATETATATNDASESPEANPSGEASASPDPGPGETPSPTPDAEAGGPSSDPSQEAASGAANIVKEMLEQVEQPSLIEMDTAQIETSYGIDLALIEEYSVHMPMMNIKTNEIAIFKVKSADDIATVKEGMEKRAKAVQKQFEQYLPDQYENAKNYKIVTNGNYVLFLISESADELTAAFNAFFD